MHHIGHYIQAEVRELISFEARTAERVAHEVITRYGGYFHAAVDTFFEEQGRDPEEALGQEVREAQITVRKEWENKILNNPSLTILYDGGNDQVLAVGADLAKVSGTLPAEI